MANEKPSFPDKARKKPNVEREKRWAEITYCNLMFVGCRGLKAFKIVFRYSVVRQTTKTIK